MSLFTRCEECGTKIHVADKLIGRRIRCQKCGATFVAQDDAEVPERSQAQAANASPERRRRAAGDPPSRGDGSGELPRAANSKVLLIACAMAGLVVVAGITAVILLVMRPSPDPIISQKAAANPEQTSESQQSKNDKEQPAIDAAANAIPPPKPVKEGAGAPSKPPLDGYIAKTTAQIPLPLRITRPRALLFSAPAAAQAAILHTTSVAKKEDELIIVDLAKESVVRRLNLPASTATPSHADFGPDGKYYSQITSLGKVSIWSVADKKRVVDGWASKKPMKSHYLLQPDLIVVIEQDLVVYQIPTMSEAYRLKIPNRTAAVLREGNGLAISPDRSRLAVGTRDGIVIFDLSARTTVAQTAPLPVEGDRVPSYRAMAFSSDGLSLAVSVNSLGVLLWYDVLTGAEKKRCTLAKAEGEKTSTHTCLAWLGSDKLVRGVASKEVQIISFDAPQPLVHATVSIPHYNERFSTIDTRFWYLAETSKGATCLAGLADRGNWPTEPVHSRLIAAGIPDAP